MPVYSNLLQAPKLLINLAYPDSAPTGDLDVNITTWMFFGSAWLALISILIVAVNTITYTIQCRVKSFSTKETAFYIARAILNPATLIASLIVMTFPSVLYGTGRFSFIPCCLVTLLISFISCTFRNYQSTYLYKNTVEPLNYFQQRSLSNIIHRKYKIWPRLWPTAYAFIVLYASFAVPLMLQDLRFSSSCSSNVNLFGTCFTTKFYHERVLDPVSSADSAEANLSISSDVDAIMSDKSSTLPIHKPTESLIENLGYYQGLNNSTVNSTFKHYFELLEDQKSEKESKNKFERHSTYSKIAKH